MGEFLTVLDKMRDELAGQFPGWQIWYVPHIDRTVTWCARPWPLINSPSAEQLAEDIAAAHEAVADWPALASREDYAPGAPGMRQAPLAGPADLILRG